ncbi:MAG: hypothetical protein LC670_03455 [Flavobacteriales bacterium]|nr:hypothetical protein [Flavobacteriales bacterium]
MKKNLLLLLIAAAQVSYTQAQCEKDISTNPVDPINEEFLPLKNNWFPSLDPAVDSYTVNSFLNTGMNWSPGTSIQLDLNAGWTHPFGNASTYTMRNPFSNAHEANHLNSGIGIPSDQNLRDFRWEDGWELLWMNTGKYPNGDPYSTPPPGTYFAHGNQPPNAYDTPILDANAPPNVPYFVLYNRYRGTLRLFANVWQGQGSNTGPQEWSVTMKYTFDSQSDEKITGLFRHASPIDRALDQFTEYTQMIGPRTQTINQSDWIVAEFPMAFDPCICMREHDGVKDPGKLEFVFESIETTDIDLYSRTIEVQSAITANNLNEDFLNLANIHPEQYHPGTATYGRMSNLFDKYQIQLERYNTDLYDYNSARNHAKGELLDVFKSFISAGINLSIPAGNIFDSIIDEDGIFGGADDPNKIVNNLIKGLVGVGVDYAAMEITGKKPEKPEKPSAPTASFSETMYKGQLTRSYHQKTSPLLVPGGITAELSSNGQSFGYGVTQLYPSIFPAYNKILGQVALLTTPNFDIEYNRTYSEMGSGAEIYPVAGINLKLRFDELIDFAINRSIDFDMNKTQTYFNIEIVMERNGIENIGMHVLTDTINSNMHVSHRFPISSSDDLHLDEIIQINSKWIGMEQMNQMVFSYNVAEKIELTNPGGIYPYTTLVDYFEDPDNGYVVKSIKLKALHDFYFLTVGSYGEQINTTQIHSYLLYDRDSDVNHTGILMDGLMPSLPEGSFDNYTPGLLTLGNETITNTHPHVHEVIGSDIYINAQSVQITGPLQIEPGYTLIIQALEQIRQSPGAEFNPNIHMRIKKDFYDIPVFEYANNDAVGAFCNNSNSYQANFPTAALQERINQQVAEEAIRKNEATTNSTSLLIYPNPARSRSKRAPHGHRRHCPGNIYRAGHLW